MHKKYKIFLISIAIGLAAAISLVVLIVAAYKTGNICRGDPLSSVDSPDGLNSVMYGVEDCFVAPTTAMWVDLNGKRVLDFDSGPEALVVKWVDDNEVNITLPSGAKITTDKTADLHAVKVNLVKIK